MRTRKPYSMCGRKKLWPVSGLEPDKVLSAVASVKKSADILNRSIVIDI